MSWPLRKSSSSSLSSVGLANNTSNNNNNNNASNLNLSRASTGSNTTTLTNPTAATATCNVGPVPRAVQLDFDKEEKKIQQLETTNKKFYKDVKSYVDKIDELNKSETKMINNLSGLASHATTLSTTNNSSSNNNNNSTLATIDTTTNSIDDDKEFLAKLKLWKELLGEHNVSCDNLKQSCQQHVIEPMKKLNLLFPQVYEAIKRRQQAFNELTKQQHKLDKALEKERTGPQMVRNEQLKNLVFSAKQQFEREHTLLMEELPKLYNSRVDYIRPCVQALLKSQTSFYENYTSFYDAILDCHQDESLFVKQNESVHQPDLSIQADTQLDDEIQKCLNEIKSLSIVAGD